MGRVRIQEDGWRRRRESEGDPFVYCQAAGPPEWP